MNAPCLKFRYNRFRTTLTRTNKRIAATTAAIKKHGDEYSKVEQWLIQKQEDLQFQEALAGMEQKGSVLYLQGYCPNDSMAILKEESIAQGWGLYFEEPSNEEHVPTLIRNPKWVDLIKPVFDFIGVTPGYKEVDISALFLIFFSIFFAMIVGDAGYGVLFLAFTGVGQCFLSRAPKALFHMLYLMSVCTVAWGVLTGNYFGIGTLPSVLDSLKVSWLLNESNVMFLCFLIGAIHLTIAHGWNAIRTIK